MEENVQNSSNKTSISALVRRDVRHIHKDVSYRNRADIVIPMLIMSAIFIVFVIWTYFFCGKNKKNKEEKIIHKGKRSRWKFLPY